MERSVGRKKSTRKITLPFPFPDRFSIMIIVRANEKKKSLSVSLLSSLSRLPLLAFFRDRKLLSMLFVFWSHFSLPNYTQICELMFDSCP